jgi:hypothetical protein
MSTQYSIYCITETAAIKEWADTPITACPHDSAHEINPNSIIATGEEVEMMRFSPLDVTVTSTYPVNVLSCIVRPKQQGVLRRVLVLASATALDTVTVRIVNVTAATVLGEFSLTSIGDEISRVDVGVLNVVPTTDFILEMTVSSTNATPVTIREIVFLREG